MSHIVFQKNPRCAYWLFGAYRTFWEVGGVRAQAPPGQPPPLDYVARFLLQPHSQRSHPGCCCRARLTLLVRETLL